MKTIAIQTAAFLLALTFFCGVSNANEYTFRLGANNSSIDSEFEASIKTPRSTITSGISGVYNEHDYKILYLKALIGNQLLAEELQGAIGFKGSIGEAEKYHIKSDIYDIGFSLAGSYKISKGALHDIPIYLI